MTEPDDPLFYAQYVPQLLGVPAVWEIEPDRTPNLGLVDTPALTTHPELDSVRHLGDGDPTPPTDHGTELAGLMVAERDNQDGIAGLCDGSLAISPLESPTPEATQLADAIRGLTADGCDVICLPYRGPRTTALTAAIEAATEDDCLIVAAAGNGPTTFADHAGAHEDVLCVGAVTRSLSPAPFSKLGGVDVFAPGVDVLAPTTGANDYEMVSGTSHASAIVAGIAGIVASRTRLTGTRLKRHLETTAAELPVRRQLQRGHTPEPLNVVQPIVEDIPARARPTEQPR
ncbi:S8 family serine peptidase [Halobaculum lipolyticum]|uniref:S8 family serine peptidase n=1 Tax=Halobaculum lipolyticum TaxID=3032001 RepID=A0ABD5WFB1_9EURY